jgi:formylmethanofuran dehydrogenase subunit B
VIQREDTTKDAEIENKKMIILKMKKMKIGNREIRKLKMKKMKNGKLKPENKNTNVSYTYAANEQAHVLINVCAEPSTRRPTPISYMRWPMCV